MAYNGTSSYPSRRGKRTRRWIQPIVLHIRGSIVACALRWPASLENVPGAAPKHRQTKRGTPNWAFRGGLWSTPTLDARRGVMYIATGDNYSSRDASQDASWRSKSRRAAWCGPDRQLPATRITRPAAPISRIARTKTEPDYDFGSLCDPDATSRGRDMLLAGQKSGMV